jgi:hypothetical protein
VMSFCVMLRPICLTPAFLARACPQTEENTLPEWCDTGQPNGLCR